MSWSWTAAACNRGARSAWARLAQCDRSVVPTPMLEVIARAISSAPSHDRDDWIGDHRSGMLAGGVPGAGRIKHPGLPVA